MSTLRKIQAAVGLALVTAFALTAGVTSAQGLQPGTKIACTMSGDTATGRRWGYLLGSDNPGVCYRYADTARWGEPAPPSVAHCKGLGSQLGCRVIDMD